MRRIDRRRREGRGDDDDDPVGSTGPRFLESALHEWDAAHGAPDDPARVYVAPADVFYPLWDAGQAATFRERCAPGEEGGGQWPAYANQSDVLARGLGAAVVAICARLAREDFTPTTYAASFCAHHWSHTWLAPLVESDQPPPPVRDRALPRRARAPPLDASTLQALGALDAALAPQPAAHPALGTTPEQAEAAPSWVSSATQWVLRLKP